MNKLFTRITGFGLAFATALALTMPSLADENSQPDSRSETSDDASSGSETAFEDLSRVLSLPEDGVEADGQSVPPSDTRSFTWTLPGQSEELSLHLQLQPGQEEWDEQAPLYVSLPDLEPVYVYTEEEGTLETASGTSLGTYAFASPYESGDDTTWLYLQPDDPAAFLALDEADFTVRLQRQDKAGQSLNVPLASQTLTFVQEPEVTEEETTAPEEEQAETNETGPEDEAAESEASAEESEETAAEPETVQTREAAPAAEETPGQELTAVSVDLNHYIDKNSVALESADKADGTFTPVTRLNGVWQVPEGSHYLRFKLGYTLPGGTLSASDDQIVYTFPPELKPVTDSGDIYDSLGCVIGTYRVLSDGRMILTYDKSIVKSNEDGEPVSGHIVATGSMGDSELSDDKETPLNLGAGLTITLKRQKPMALSIQKDAGASQGRTIPYTITVSSKGGTASPVTITDSWQAPLDKAENIKVYAPDGQLISSANVSSNDNGFVISGLPALKNGESYKVTYDGEIDPDRVADAKVSNTAEASAADEYGEPLNSTVTHEATYSGPLSLKKTGTMLPDGQVEWTVHLNENGLDIGGWQLHDTLNGVHISGPVTITPAEGAPITTDLPYDFPAGFDSPCTLTYTTSAQPEPGTNAVRNTATMTKGKQCLSSTASIMQGTGTFAPLTKKGRGITIGEDGKQIKPHWRIIVSADPYAIDGPWTLTDWTDGTDGHGFDSEQVQAFEKKVEEAAAKEGISDVDFAVYEQASGGSPVTSLSDTGNYQRIVITFKQSLAEGKTLEIDFDTSCTNQGVPEGTTFYNHISINGTDTQTASNIWTGKNTGPETGITISKLDNTKNWIFGGNPSSEKNTTHAIGDLTSGTLSWKVPITIPADWDGGALTITDSVPAGLTWRPALTGLTFNDRKVSLDDTDDGHQISGSYDGQSFTIDFSEADRTLTMVLSPELIKAMGNQAGGVATKLELTLCFLLSNDVPWKTDGKDGGSSADFDNQATVTSPGGPEGSASQTQTVTMPVLYKEGAQPANNELPGNVIPYRIDFNKAGLKLNSGDPITLVDTLSYNFQDNSVTSVTLVPGSLKVLGADGKPLPASKWHYTYSITMKNGVTTNQLTFTIEDGQPVTILYDNLVHSTNDNQWPMLSNTVTATLDGHKKSSNALSFFHFSTAQVTGNLTGIDVIKQDAEDASKKLAGAVFTIQTYKNGTWTDFKTGLTTDENGEVADTSIPLNTLCRLVETKAPEGYALPAAGAENACYYFWISDTTTDPKLPEAYAGITHVFQGGGLVFVNNKPTATALKVHKEWKNSAGQKIEAGTDQISFNIIQTDADGHAVQYNQKPYTLSAPDWKTTITGLPREDDKGRLYTYKAEEINPPAGWKSSVRMKDTAGNTPECVITNTGSAPVSMPDTGSSGLSNLLMLSCGFVLLSLFLSAGRLKLFHLHK